MTTQTAPRRPATADVEAHVASRTATVAWVVVCALIFATSWTGLAGSAWIGQGCTSADAAAAAWTDGLPRPADDCTPERKTRGRPGPAEMLARG